MTSVLPTRADPMAFGHEGASIFERTFPLLLVGFVFLDRGFAWFHIPGTPIFITEIVLITGLAAAIRGVARPLVWARTNTIVLLVAFLVWGVIRTVPGLFEDIEASLRDAANWTYILAGLAVLDLLLRRPATLGRWLEGYRRLIVPIVLIVPLVAFLAEQTTGINVPDSDVSLFSYKPGNAAVHVFLAVAFLWAIWRPQGIRATRWRYLVTGVGLAVILALSTQGRGGFVAVTVAGALLLILTAERSRLMMSVAGSLLALAVIFLAIDPRVEVGGRDVSAEQFADNVSSIVTGEGEGELGGTVDWRMEHWGRVWRGVNDTVPLIGHGFGVNLADFYGIPQADIGLRNAHNSHLTVLARMGWIGGGVWISLWLVWFTETWRAWRKYRDLGLPVLSGTCAWAMVGVAAIHINAIFDPTLEGPQVAVWLWALTGLGMFAVIMSRATRPSLGVESPVVRLENSLQLATSSGHDASPPDRRRR